MRFKQFFDLIKDSVTAWIDDDAPSMGASVAFYTVFSLAPLLLIVIAVAGAVWGEDAVRGEIMNQVSELVGRDGAQGVETLLKGADEPKQGAIATLISLVVLVVGATTVFAELQRALDRIWKVSAREKVSGIWNTVRARLLSFGLVLGLAFLLLVSLIVSAFFGALGRWGVGLLPGWELMLQALNTAASIAMMTVMFAAIFKFMPQVRIAWRDVWTGAFVTAVLFEIGKVLIGLYVGKSASISSLTAAGSLVVVLIWVYYASQIFLLGAEFTWTYASKHGSHARGDESVQAGAESGIQRPNKASNPSEMAPRHTR
ncbi:YihY/virulence factor BrkB family protein [Alcaligenaceae bacterium]|nr:YihY/virulence factor BrkB family protein [Alcaligenaceae bacterium]